MLEPRRLLVLAFLASTLVSTTGLDAADLKSRQNGTTTLADGSATTTATLATAVTTNRAFLVFGLGANTVNPADGQVTGQLTGPTTLTFSRIGTAGTLTLSWYVVEFVANVTVQRGIAIVTGTSPVDVPLAAVNTAKAFPILTYRAAGTNFNQNDFVRAEITTGTNLQLTHNLANATTPEIVEWQVVEYLDANVQTGSLTFADTDTSLPATLAPAVNPAKSWLILSYACALDCPDDTNMGAKMVRGTITNGTTLTFDRSVTGVAESLLLTWHLVEFTDATTVQRGSAAFTGGATMATGSYTANGAATQSIAGLGFRPDVVMVKVDYSDGVNDDLSSAVIRTSTMVGVNSKPMKGTQGFLANLITSLDADGFTVGNDERVNWQAGNCGGTCTYHWVAFKATANLKVGTYTGNPPNLSVTGLGFSPEYVMAIPTSTTRVLQRTNQDPDTYQFWAGGSLPGRITSLNTDGFSVSNSAAPSANSNSVLYHYVAFNEVPGQLKLGTYVGAAGAQAVTGVGFQPRYMVVKGLSPATFDSTQASDAMPAATSLNFRNASDTNSITALPADGFAVGTSTQVNNPGSRYAYLAFGDASESVDVVLSSIRPGLSIATTAGAYMRGGRTSYQADDNVGVASFTLDLLTPTKLKITRGAKGPASANAGWYVVSFTTPTTAVELSSFTAAAADSVVDLSWSTGSELENLGFHLHRSVSAEGPFARITSALIPGLGSTPFGQGYHYRDASLQNGTTYYYKLEDVDAAGVSTLHGPVSAAPSASATGDDGSDPSGRGGSSAGLTVHGDPSATSLTVLERDARHLLLELRTGGFYSRPNIDGTVDIEIPGFESTARPGAPDLPTRSTWMDAVAGRKVVLTSVEAQDTVSFSDLRPAPVGTPGIRVSRDGMTVRPTRLRRGANSVLRRGTYPRVSARILGTGFQQETKKAHLELSPLRFNASTGQLLLSRRLLVRVDFTGKDPAEISLGGSRGRGRRPVIGLRSSPGAVQLLARDKGLYRASFEDVFPGSRPVPLSLLRLSRKGALVPFHVDRPSFGPGASLYFVSDGAALNPNGPSAVYEITQLSGGLRMATTSASPSGSSTSFAYRRLTWEQNKTYQSGLLDAPELWLWEVLVSPVTKTYSFTIDQLASASEAARLAVDLQGASDFEADPDHHVRISVNGAFVGEASWDGKLPRTIEAEVGPGLLLEGANTLQIENVGDTAASYSMVLLDRFSLSYPRLLSAAGGVFEGTVSETGSGIVEVSGLAADSLVVDTTGAAPLWLTGAIPGVSGLSFRAEGGHRYLAVSPASVLRPDVRRPSATNLRATQNRADYLLIAPREFFPVIGSLIDLRQSQGLHTRSVALEDVYDQFGSGEEGPAAVKAFLSHAYHSWQKPSPRYVLLLGDASYDPKDFTKTGTKDRLPTPLARTSFIWTASDPSYAQVNGDDLLPDLALGRLPAANLAEAQVMIDKILAFEGAQRDLSGPAVLVADNEDQGGPFEKNADEIASLLPGRPVEKLYLRDLAAQGLDTRTAIRNALDNGASLLSYVGHGSIAVWASENVWNNLDVNALQPQPQQPLLLTLDCLNGFFHFPPLNSLTEQMVKAESKGALAAVSPSGLSLDQPAHVFHKALVGQLLSGNHDRLGDALLAAQSDYATTGAFPELLAIYHLFGDPATRIR